MTVPTTSLPSLGQWRLLTRLLIRSPIAAECRASRMLDRANCDPGDLGELAEEGWVSGRHETGMEIDLAENWWQGLAHVFLTLTAKGHAWLAGNPHTRLLFEIADAQGAYQMKPAEVKDKDEVLTQLADRNLITMETESGAPVLPGPKSPSQQVPGAWLYLRLTERGRSIVSP